LRLEPAVFATSRQQTTSSATSLPNCSGDDSAASEDRNHRGCERNSGRKENHIIPPGSIRLLPPVICHHSKRGRSRRVKRGFQPLACWLE
jgi:hypothetical protein